MRREGKTCFDRERPNRIQDEAVICIEQDGLHGGQRKEMLAAGTGLDIVRIVRLLLLASLAAGTALVLGFEVHGQGQWARAQNEEKDEEYDATPVCSTSQYHGVDE